MNEGNAAINWDDIDVPAETVDDAAAAAAEAMGKTPVGKFICVCVGSQPKEAKLKAYTCYAANLKWQIEEVLEINGKPATDSDKDAHEDRFIFDDVLLYNAAEKDGMRNRRLLVAMKTGLITNKAQADNLPKSAWATGILGKRAIVTTELNRYEVTDKVTDEKIQKSNVKVKFDGYESVIGAAKASADNYGDI